MKKRILSLLVGLMCTGAVLPQEQKRTFTIDEIAHEMGITFIDKHQRDLKPEEVRAVSQEGELVIELGKQLLLKMFFKDGRLRRRQLPQTSLSPKAQEQICEAIHCLNKEALPPESMAKERLALPDLFVGLLDFAHSLVGMVDEKIVPAMRAYLSGLFLGGDAKHVKFATPVETS